MKLSENLHYLRKRDKITQEELADRLGVSRQSVSKWETGEAYPETDKLISICDVFSVTLDELVRGDLTSCKTPTDAAEFGAHMNTFSKSMAAGIFLILFGAALFTALSGVALAYGMEIMDVLSVTAVLVFVAAGIFLFVFFGIKHDNFKKEHPEVDPAFGEREVKAFTKRFNLAIALLVTGIIADVIFIVVLSSIIDLKDGSDALYCYVAAVFLAVFACLVGGLVYYGIQRTKYNVSEYNKQIKKEGTARSKIKEAVCSAVMLFATALFLVLGFVGGWWHPGWVVFPVGGIICGIVSAIINAKGD